MLNASFKTVQKIIVQKYKKKAFLLRLDILPYHVLHHQVSFFYYIDNIKLCDNAPHVRKYSQHLNNLEMLEFILMSTGTIII